MTTLPVSLDQGACIHRFFLVGARAVWGPQPSHRRHRACVPDPQGSTGPTPDSGQIFLSAAIRAVPLRPPLFAEPLPAPPRSRSNGSALPYRWGGSSLDEWNGLLRLRHLCLQRAGDESFPVSPKTSPGPRSERSCLTSCILGTLRLPRAQTLAIYMGDGKTSRQPAARLDTATFIAATAPMSAAFPFSVNVFGFESRYRLDVKVSTWYLGKIR